MEARLPQVDISVSRQVSFTRPTTTVLAATQTVVAADCPVDGLITNITLHFPNGCNALVELSCFVNQEQILPVSGFIALNDATKEFPIFKKVTKKSVLRVLVVNRDGGFPHTPSIIFHLEGIP
jgi:hypothetical protein